MQLRLFDNTLKSFGVDMFIRDVAYMFSEKDPLYCIIICIYTTMLSLYVLKISMKIVLSTSVFPSVDVKSIPTLISLASIFT